MCKIHRRLPPGHLLVFVTGQREVMRLCRLLQDTFPSTASTSVDGGGREGGKRGKKRRRRGGDVDLDKCVAWRELEM